MTAPYPYTGRDLFAEPERYFYADCASPDFLEGWRASRDSGRARLAERTADCGTTGEPTGGTDDLMSLLEASLRDLRTSPSPPPDVVARLDTLVVKFEMFRRLFAAYGADGRRLPDASLAGPEHYVRFATCLARVAEGANDLRYLSALLKLTDALLSLPPEQFAPEDAAALIEVLDREQALVARWEADADVNNPDIVAAIADAPGDTIVYFGLGGVILGKALLGCGKRFLHIHGGYAPRYRGSTAFYYSLLRERSMGATALWLGNRIDAGPVLARRRYPPPKGVDIDRVGDPMIRAHLLSEVLRGRRDTGAFADAFRDDAGATTYHVIHPVLKHLALRRTAPGLDQ